MEIVGGGKGLIVRTKTPERITSSIEKSKQLDANQVLVKWDVPTAQSLIKLGYKKTPSPINYNYSYPGRFQPYSHQRRMAEFATLHPRHFNFALMGAGKTMGNIWAADYLMTIGLVKRVLIIAPLSVMKTAWEADIFKTALHRTVGIAHGTQQQRVKVIHGSAEFVIINHDGIKTVRPELAKAKFDLIIVDEASAFNSSQTKRWKALHSLLRPETLLWMLTGTPAARDPLAAYGLAKLVNPNGVPPFFSGWKDKTMIKVSTFTYVPKPDAQEIVHAALQPAILITKEECPELPPVVYVERDVPMSATQELYYKKMKTQMLMQAAGETITAVNAGVLLNKLLQISAGTVYSDDGEVVDFNAAARLADTLQIVDECEEQVLIFSTWRHSIQAIHTYLTKHGVTAEIIDGSVTGANRARIIDQFQHTKTVKVLIIQPQAAAHGITLTAASTTVWFNPTSSLELWLQANARMDRPGQVNKMTIVKMFSSAVERKVYKMLEARGLNQDTLLKLYQEEIEKEKLLTV